MFQEHKFTTKGKTVRILKGLRSEIERERERQEYHCVFLTTLHNWKYRVIISILDPRKCEYLKDYSLRFEHAYMTTYLAS